MSLIDQRILIVAPVETVWTYLSDPAMMSKWLRNCKQLSVLSTKTTGVGARRRCIDARGRAEVVETTAYFENIGYEYRVVDGPYREFRGRFRLQAIPEGTIVNWTVEYRLRGFLSELRNFLSFRRHFEDMMAESLRGLRRLVEASGVRLDPEKHARFAMQDGPSPERRAARSSETTQPGALRPVAVSDDDVPEVSPSDIAGPTVVRVPPPPPETPAEPGQQPAAAAPAPDDAAVSDTRPRAPKGLRELLTAQKNAEKSQTEAEEQAAASKAQSAPTVPISMVAPAPEPPQETQTVEFEPGPPAIPDTLPERVPTKLPPKQEPLAARSKPAEPVRPAEKAPIRPPEKQPEQSAEDAPPTDKLDTGQVSIWEVFGVEPPSERTKGELEGLIASIQPKPDDEQAPSVVTERQRRVREPRTKARPPVRGVHSNHPPRQKKSVRARSPGRGK